MKEGPLDISRMSKRGTGSHPAKKSTKRDAKRRDDDDDDDIFGSEVAASFAAAPKTKAASTPTTTADANSKLALFALTSTASSLILRDIYGLRLDKDFLFLLLATVTAAFFQFRANSQTFEAIAARHGKTEIAVWKALMLNGAFHFLLSVFLYIYLFDYFFNGFAATISENGIVDPSLRMKARYFSCVVIPSLVLYFLRPTTGM